MGDLSPHFSRKEFACKCGCMQNTVDAELITVLEKVRNHFDASVTISSGNRCPYHNKKVGGVPDSQHLRSKAADIKVAGVTPHEVYAWIDPWHVGGLHEYPTFVHVDVRGVRARWT